METVNLQSELDYILSLKDGWDGDNTFSPNEDTIANLNYVLDGIGNYKNNIYDIYPNDHGTVSIVWEFNNSEEVDLEIGESQCGFYSKLNGKFKPFNNREFTANTLIELNNELYSLYNSTPTRS
jgi:hypothetical protein